MRSSSFREINPPKFHYFQVHSLLRNSTHFVREHKKRGGAETGVGSASLNRHFRKDVRPSGPSLGAAMEFELLGP